MIAAGVDVGSLTTKTVILQDNKIRAFSIIPTGADSEKAARECFERTLREGNLDSKDLAAVVATGYGRIRVPFATRNITEITCHALGAHWLFPDTRLVVDVGGQDSKVISIDDGGRVVDFVMNDKCAAGTGRFLEVMAQALEVKLEELGELSLRAKKRLVISSMCTVFAESEVISLIAEGQAKEDIIRGLHEAIASRIFGMMQRLRMERSVTMTGGVAKNKGIVKALEQRLKFKIHVPPEPQIVGALGAALAAQKIGGF